MIYSMTGYGRAEKIEEDLALEFVVEIKSVNHRYSEIVIKQPRQYIFLENDLRKIIQSRIQRGRVDVFINIKNSSQRQSQMRVDRSLAKDYYNALRQLINDINITSDLDISNKISMFEIASLPEVIKEEENEVDLEKAKIVLEKATNEALEQLLKMRQVEGKALLNDLLIRIEKLKEHQARIIERSPLMLEDYQVKLEKRIEELLIEQVDENRLSQEIAFMVEKSDLTEELVRLDSHFDQFISILELNGAIGRKLDFLVQEMHREINTIGSKANDSEIAHLVVEMKTEVEKIREQIQNIE